MVHFIFIAPMHSYVTNVLVYNLHMAIFSRVCSYVTRMLLVCYSYVLVCYSYVTRMYLYVTRMYSSVLVCARMLLVCYSCVVLVTIIELSVDSQTIDLPEHRTKKQTTYMFFF